jgi:hypothetical protein
MENDKDTSEMIKKGSKAAEQTAETIGDTIIQVIDRLAGKKSDLRLTFDNLELGAQGINARINGAIVLDVLWHKMLKQPHLQRCAKITQVKSVITIFSSLFQFLLV